MSLSNIMKKKYISIPGFTSRLYIYKPSNVRHNLSKITLMVTSITDSYDMYNLHEKQRSNKWSYFERVTDNYGVKNSMFIVFTKNVEKMSWNEGSKQCKEIGGHLPYFTNTLMLK